MDSAGACPSAFCQAFFRKAMGTGKGENDQKNVGATSKPFGNKRIKERRGQAQAQPRRSFSILLSTAPAFAAALPFSPVYMTTFAEAERPLPHGRPRPAFVIPACRFPSWVNEELDSTDHCPPVAHGRKYLRGKPCPLCLHGGRICLFTALPPFHPSEVNAGDVQPLMTQPFGDL